MVSSFTLTCQANSVAGINPWRDLHGKCLGILEPSLTLTGTARILDLLTGSPARGTRLLDRKETLLHADCPVPLAGRAGDGSGPFRSAAAAALLARIPSGNTNLDFSASDRFFEGQLEVVSEIRATLGAPSALGATENSSKDITEDVAETVPGESKAACTAH
jgi:hypothetical protein